MEFVVKDFFSKCGQIRIFSRICSHLLKKLLKENFIFYAVINNSQYFKHLRFIAAKKLHLHLLFIFIFKGQNSKWDIMIKIIIFMKTNWKLYFLSKAVFRKFYSKQVGISSVSYLLTSN